MMHNLLFIVVDGVIAFIITLFFWKTDGTRPNSRSPEAFKAWWNSSGMPIWMITAIIVLPVLYIIGHKPWVIRFLWPDLAPGAEY